MLLAIFLFILGIAIPLLLNGQTFTNGIVGIVFLSASAVRCVILERRAGVDDDEYVYRRIVAGLCVIIIVMLILQMPANHEFQSQFNQGVEKLRQAEQQVGFPNDPEIPNP